MSRSEGGAVQPCGLMVSPFGREYLDDKEIRDAFAGEALAPH
ncbi:MAG: hypothetical protein ACPGGK_12085 [Pikeienuella sp.]